MPLRAPTVAVRASTFKLAVNATGKDAVTAVKTWKLCCPPVSRYTLQLSNVHKDKKGHWAAKLTVTNVRIDQGGYRFPGIHKGTTGTVVIRRHVWHDSLFETTYCDPHAAAFACGA